MSSTPERSSFTRSAMNASETATGIPARSLLEQCGLLPAPPPDAVILDNACGAAIVTQRLLEATEPQLKPSLTIVCGDRDQTMVDLSKDRITANNWTAHAQAERLDAQALTYPDGHFTHVVMNFGPQLMSDPMLMLKETHRVLRDGGITGFTCWTSPGWVPSIQAVSPSFASPGALSSPWKDPEAIRANLAQVGFDRVEVKTLDFETREEDLDAYLELMGILLSKLLAGENAELYARHMREKYARGEKTMYWQALVVSAVKA